MKFKPVLDTKRLMLSPLRRRDILFFLRLVKDPQTRQFLGGPVAWRRAIDRFQDHRRGHPMIGAWVARQKSDKAAIGLLVLHPHKDGQDYEVSYEFLPSFWGHGLATEAVASLVHHAIHDLELPRVLAETQSLNVASCRLLLTLGFQEVRRLERFGAQQVIFASR